MALPKIAYQGEEAFGKLQATGKRRRLGEVGGGLGEMEGAKGQKEFARGTSCLHLQGVEMTPGHGKRTRPPGEEATSGSEAGWVQWPSGREGCHGTRRCLGSAGVGGCHGTRRCLGSAGVGGWYGGAKG